MPRGLDHIVHAVRDLDAAADLYRRLGFSVGARNRHPWGTHNHIVQLPGFFIELLTLAEPDKIGDDGFCRLFAAYNRDFVQRHEGLSLLIVESQDADADAAVFRSAGIAGSDKLHFEREGRTARPRRSASPLLSQMTRPHRKFTLPVANNIIRRISGIRLSRSTRTAPPASRALSSWPSDPTCIRFFCRRQGHQTRRRLHRPDAARRNRRAGPCRFRSSFWRDPARCCKRRPSGGVAVRSCGSRTFGRRPRTSRDRQAFRPKRHGDWGGGCHGRRARL